MRCDQKIIVIFKFRELRMYDIRMLVHMSVIYVDNVSHFGMSVLFLTDKKVSCVLVCSGIFYYSQKWIKEIVLNFV